MIGVLMCQQRVCSTITQFVSQQCKSVECCLCICLFKLVCLRGAGLFVWAFGCGEEDKLCFDLFTRVCFSWLRSFCRPDVLSFPHCMSLQPVRQSVRLDLRCFRFSLYKTLFIFEITPFDVCFILKLLLVSSQRAISRMLNRNCCLRRCCLLL